MVNKNTEWLKLKKFGKNKFVLNTTIFLILTPLLFKIKVFIEEVVSTYIGKTVQLEVPFTWQFLFYAALIFGLATFLFRIYCPKLIYEYSSLGEYEFSGKYIRQLYPFIEEIETKENLEKYFNTDLLISNKYKGQLPQDFKFKTEVHNRKFIDKIFHTYSEYHYLNKLQFIFVKDNPEKTREKRQFLDLHFKNLFEEIFDLLNLKNLTIRAIIGILYLIGTILVAVTLIENLIFVITHSI